MNDTPITDFDKLKNTLIEIGVEYSHPSTRIWQGLTIETTYHTITFGFTPEGKYIGVDCED